MRSRPAILLGLLVLFAPPETLAVVSICVPDVPVRMDRWIRVPLGCELVDCCPGCPLDQPIDLRIRLSGELVAGAELRIEGEPGTTDRVVPLRTGEVRLPAVARSGETGRPAVAMLRLRPDEAVLERWRKKAPPAGAGRDAVLGSVEVAIEQLLADRVVNAKHSRWQIESCAALGPCDRIVQSGNPDADASVLQVDGRRSTSAGVCLDDLIRRSAGSTGVGNLRPPGGCRSEVSIYSTQNAMAMEEEVDVWTEACGDELKVALEPILDAPATFFLAVPDPMAKLQWEGQTVDQVAKEDLDHANQLFDLNKAGLSFTAEFRKLDVLEIGKLATQLPAVIFEVLKTTWDPVGFACNVTGGLEALGYYIPGRLNVYYLAVPGTGMYCPDDPNIVFMALDKKPATLAHEFGHSQTLQHTTGMEGFASDNIMWGGPDVRDHFALGQVFRMNVEKASTINVNQVRQGPTRTCALENDPTACPPLERDWARP
jgi:hypothetical protein